MWTGTVSYVTGGLLILWCFFQYRIMKCEVILYNTILIWLVYLNKFLNTLLMWGDSMYIQCILHLEQLRIKKLLKVENGFTHNLCLIKWAFSFYKIHSCVFPLGTLMGSYKCYMILVICSEGHFINKYISGVSCVLISHVMFSVWLEYIDFEQNIPHACGKT